MNNRKNDMAAAAAGLALIEWLFEQKELTRDVHIIAPMVVNGIGHGAMCPGDVYVSKSGRTVEIGHTDAEGRLVLADGISYAEELGASVIVTIATLTGAQVVALGDSAALYSNDETLAAQIRLAALEAGESVHQMPLDARTVSDFDSDVADTCNVPSAKVGGSIAAALFLKGFLKPGNDTRFAHLDIAGPSWMGKPKFGHQNAGPSGFGVLTIAAIVRKLCIGRG